MREEMKNLLEMPIEELMQMSVEELEKYSEEERAQAWRRVAAERLRETSAGVLHLFQPMRSRGEAVSELHYDFSVLTSRDAHDLEEQACIADTDAMVERAAAFFTSSKLVTKVGL